MNANREYQQTQTGCRVAVTRISAALDAHAVRQAAKPEYWTYVGDLKKTRIDLLHVAAFLGDQEAREILYAEEERP